jgi:hypothetical protein
LFLKLVNTLSAEPCRSENLTPSHASPTASPPPRGSPKTTGRCRARSESRLRIPLEAPALTSRTWRGGGAHRSRPQGTRRVAAAKKGGSRGAVPVRSPAWTINCQRARGRGAARRGRRASFPRPPPIRRGLCCFQRTLRAAFPASRALPRPLRASFPALSAPFPPAQMARSVHRAAFPAPRVPRRTGSGSFPARRAVRRGGMEREDLSESCTSQGTEPDSWGMSHSPLFVSHPLWGKPSDL